MVLLPVAVATACCLFCCCSALYLLHRHRRRSNLRWHHETEKRLRKSSAQLDAQSSRESLKEDSSQLGEDTQVHVSLSGSAPIEPESSRQRVRRVDDDLAVERMTWQPGLLTTMVSHGKLPEGFLVSKTARGQIPEGLPPAIRAWHRGGNAVFAMQRMSAAAAAERASPGSANHSTNSDDLDPDSRPPEYASIDPTSLTEPRLVPTKASRGKLPDGFPPAIRAWHRGCNAVLAVERLSAASGGNSVADRHSAASPRDAADSFANTAAMLKMEFALERARQVLGSCEGLRGPYLLGAHSQ